MRTIRGGHYGSSRSNDKRTQVFTRDLDCLYSRRALSSCLSGLGNSSHEEQRAQCSSNGKGTSMNISMEFCKRANAMYVQVGRHGRLLGALERHQNLSGSRGRAGLGIGSQARETPPPISPVPLYRDEGEPRWWRRQFHVRVGPMLALQAKEGSKAHMGKMESGEVILALVPAVARYSPVDHLDRMEMPS